MTIWKLTRLILADEFVTTMVDDTLHADQAHTRDAKVSHELFRMYLAKIRILHHLMMLAGILKRQVILRQLLGFERLL